VWVKQHQRAGQLDAVPFQEAPWPPMTPALYQQCQQAIHVRLADGRLLRGGQACVYILQVIGYRRLAKVLSLWPLCWITETVYALMAQHRQFFSRFLFTKEC
jgi:predicted DCC family thiol-disulfide oxidoreductase YuxK